MARKSVLFVYALSLLGFGQIDTTVFPKIGFDDMYGVASWLGENTPEYFHRNRYYYDELTELGLTHLVAHADSVPLGLNGGYNTKLKIIDSRFDHYGIWEKDGRYRAFDPWEFATASGNALDFTPYELGGPKIDDINDAKTNFGFGNNGRTSWWVPDDTSIVIDKNYHNDGTYAYFADVKNKSHRQGVIVRTLFDGNHSPKDKRVSHRIGYRVGIRAKIDGVVDGTVVCIVRVKTRHWSPESGADANAVKAGKECDCSNQDDAQAVFPITAAELGNGYRDYYTPPFHKCAGAENQLIVEIDWTKKRSIYIDKMCVFDELYDSLFITRRRSVYDSIRNELSARMTNRDSRLYCHLYKDEPSPMTFRALGAVDSIWGQLTGGNRMNGASPALTFDYIQLADLQRKTAGHPGRLPYILYDYYVFTDGIDTNSTTAVQAALDKYTADPAGSFYGAYRYRGLKSAIMWAHDFDTAHISPTSHVPMYSTIQVQAERIGKYDIAGEETKFRAPTFNEILAQGWLSVCYGAKGLMYYTIPTKTPSREPKRGAEYYAVWGLFEEKDKPFYPAALWQNQRNEQTPNVRYNAVKELNRQMDQISTELLSLTWKNGYSMHRTGLPDNECIKSVASYYWDPRAKDGAALVEDQRKSAFIEVGCFKKTAEIQNPNLDYFILVNRRTNADRYIEFAVNKDGADNKYWKISEAGTENVWYKTKGEKTLIYIPPGTGKLFRLEPVRKPGE